MLLLAKFLRANEEQIFMSFIRLCCVEDVPKVKINNNDNHDNNKSNDNNNGTNNNGNILLHHDKKSKRGYGAEIISVGDTIKLDRLLDLTCKYHKKMVAKIAQFTPSSLQ